VKKCILSHKNMSLTLKKRPRYISAYLIDVLVVNGLWKRVLETFDEWLIDGFHELVQKLKFNK